MKSLCGFAALACLAVTGAAFAQTETLTYTGAAFTDITASGGGGFVNIIPNDTGTIVLSSPLGDNLNDAAVDPVSWSFDGGTQIGGLLLNSANDPYVERNVPGYVPFFPIPGNFGTFIFSTSSDGQIISWSVDISGGAFDTESPSDAIMTLGTTGDTYQSLSADPNCPPSTYPYPGTGCFSVSESNSAAGSWTQSIAPAPEINPSFAGSGMTLLAGMLAMMRGRKRAPA